jgi:hypothetical protein
MRIKMMVEVKLLDSRILEKDELDIFLFQYTSLLTTWVISQEMYYRQTEYKKRKPVYIRGAMQLFLPFLTPKGRKAYQLAAAAYTKKSIDHSTKKK